MPNRLERLRSWYEAHGKGDVDFYWLLRVVEAAEEVVRSPRSTMQEGANLVLLRAVLDEEDKG